MGNFIIETPCLPAAFDNFQDSLDITRLIPLEFPCELNGDKHTINNCN